MKVTYGTKRRLCENELNIPFDADRTTDEFKSDREKLRLVSLVKPNRKYFFFLIVQSYFRKISVKHERR
jgi:hypothetical protein